MQALALLVVCGRGVGSVALMLGKRRSWARREPKATAPSPEAELVKKSRLVSSFIAAGSLIESLFQYRVFVWMTGKESFDLLSNKDFRTDMANEMKSEGHRLD